MLQSRPRSTSSACRLLPGAFAKKKPRSGLEGADLRPRRWEVFWPVVLQGVCWAILLSDLRDRVVLLVLSVLVRPVIQQVGNPHLWEGNPYF